MTTEEKIKSQIADNQILLYMKGSPEQPQCGFSQRATQILICLLYTSPSPRDRLKSRMPSSA